MRTTGNHMRALIVACLVCAGVAGCSGKPDVDAGDTSSAAPQPPPVDPRYASAQALVEQFNSLTTHDPVDVVAVNALFYAENSRQKALIDVTGIMVPIIPLNDAMQARFKEPLDPTTPKAFVNKANGPAKITQDQGERAVATYKEWDGRTETLQLVKYNSRWWISGYTIEQSPKLKDITDDDITFMRIVFGGMAAVAPTFVERIKSGEFKSASEARRALQFAAGREAGQNPANVQQLREIAQRNPKYAAMFNAVAARPGGGGAAASP